LSWRLAMAAGNGVGGGEDAIDLVEPVAPPTSAKDQSSGGTRPFIHNYE